MKKDIHPEAHTDAVTKCSCGATFHIPNVLKELSIEICSACHPFYTGTQKLIDTAGNVDRFKRRQEAAAAMQKSA